MKFLCIMNEMQENRTAFFLYVLMHPVVDRSFFSKDDISQAVKSQTLVQMRIWKTFSEILFALYKNEKKLFKFLVSQKEYEFVYVCFQTFLFMFFFSPVNTLNLSDTHFYL